MTGVSDINKCPICDGPLETYLETKTSEFDDVCRGACGYSSYAEIESNSVTGLKYWVETQYFPMSKDGTMVARPKGQHKWNLEEFPTVDRPVETVLVMVYKNADSLTGCYTMITDAEGNKSAPPIEWELGLLQLSAWDMWQLKGLTYEDKSWHDCDYSVGINEYHEQKEFYRMSSRARWTTHPELVKAVEADRLASDFHPAVLIPDKGRVIRFAILRPEVGEEIEEVF
jgi:hypothetical protein